MTQKKLSSWQKRRWKIFKNAYNTDAAFRAALDALNPAQEYAKLYEEVFNVLVEYKVSTQPVAAVVLFVTNKHLLDKEYMNEITIPLQIWSAELDCIAPGAYSLELFFTMMLRPSIRKFGITKEQVPEFVQSVLQDIGRDSIVLQVEPYVNISELRELITDSQDELKSLLQRQTPKRNTYSSADLLGKVQPPKLKRHSERDALIIKLHDENVSDEDIAARLVMADYSVLTPNNIRQIRYRLKKKQQ